MLRVVDLFCGPGGISEGLRLAGCKTVFALDKDGAAVQTFRHNHPDAEVVEEDIEAIRPEALPTFDILVGGPPCIEFSTSKGGRANVLEGLKLVQAFLRIVHVTRPRWWIMENVPRLMQHLPERIPLRWIGLDDEGELPVPVRAEFNTADYGVPQLRRRCLLGSFPLPGPTHFDAQGEPLAGLMAGLLPWRTIGLVLGALPDPLRPVGAGATVTDPNYGFTVPASLVSDHLHEVILSDEEVTRIRAAKTNHPYMGRMAFPDELNRPARTVVATQLGRETLVIGCSRDGRPACRRATVRECATLQSFPITYQFLGGSLNARYRLAGDAVPPLLGWAIGRVILKSKGLPIPHAPLVRTIPPALAPPVPLRRRKQKTNFPLDRRFRRMVPGKEVRGCRVDLDNTGDHPRQAVLRPAGSMNLVEWTACLYVGEGKAVMRQRPFTAEEALWEFSGRCLAAALLVRQAALRFLEDAYDVLAGNVPDATTLQAVWAGHHVGADGPDDVAATLAALVDRHFPAGDFADIRVPRSGRFDLVPERGLRIRIAAGLVVAAMACELTNGDSRWVSRPDSRRFIHQAWPARGAVPPPAPGLPSPGEVFSRILRRRGGEPLASA
jgi:DNA (cytosine-5)-methyltransferase 1